MSTLKVNRIEPRTGDTVEIVGLDIPETPEPTGGQLRAWVRFNGTGTVSIYGSANVSSITDNGVGSYTVNLETAMPDSNYATFCSCGVNNSLSGAKVRSLEAGSYWITSDSGGTLTDYNHISTGVFR